MTKRKEIASDPEILLQQILSLTLKDCEITEHLSSIENFMQGLGAIRNDEILQPFLLPDSELASEFDDLISNICAHRDRVSTFNNSKIKNKHTLTRLEASFIALQVRWQELQSSLNNTLNLEPTSRLTKKEKTQDEPKLTLLNLSADSNNNNNNVKVEALPVDVKFELKPFITNAQSFGANFLKLIQTYLSPYETKIFSQALTKLTFVKKEPEKEKKEVEEKKTEIVQYDEVLTNQIFFDQNFWKEKFEQLPDFIKMESLRTLRTRQDNFDYKAAVFNILDKIFTHISQTTRNFQPELAKSIRILVLDGNHKKAHELFLLKGVEVVVSCLNLGVFDGLNSSSLFQLISLFKHHALLEYFYTTLSVAISTKEEPYKGQPIANLHGKPDKIKLAIIFNRSTQEIINLVTSELHQPAEVYFLAPDKIQEYGTLAIQFDNREFIYWLVESLMTNQSIQQDEKFKCLRNLLLIAGKYYSNNLTLWLHKQLEKHFSAVSEDTTYLLLLKLIKHQNHTLLLTLIQMLPNLDATHLFMDEEENKQVCLHTCIERANKQDQDYLRSLFESLVKIELQDFFDKCVDYNIDEMIVNKLPQNIVTITNSKKQNVIMRLLQAKKWQSVYKLLSHPRFQNTDLTVKDKDGNDALTYLLYYGLPNSNNNNTRNVNSILRTQPSIYTSLLKIIIDRVLKQRDQQYKFPDSENSLFEFVYSYWLNNYTLITPISATTDRSQMPFEDKLYLALVNRKNISSNVVKRFIKAQAKIPSKELPASAIVGLISIESMDNETINAVISGHSMMVHVFTILPVFPANEANELLEHIFKIVALEEGVKHSITAKNNIALNKFLSAYLTKDYVDQNYSDLLTVFNHSKEYHYLCDAIEIALAKNDSALYATAMQLFFKIIKPEDHAEVINVLFKEDTSVTPVWRVQPTLITGHMGLFNHSIFVFPGGIKILKTAFQTKAYNFAGTFISFLMGTHKIESVNKTLCFAIFNEIYNGRPPKVLEEIINHFGVLLFNNLTQISSEFSDTIYYYCLLYAFRSHSKLLVDELLNLKTEMPNSVHIVKIYSEAVRYGYSQCLLKKSNVSWRNLLPFFQVLHTHSWVDLEGRASKNLDLVLMQQFQFSLDRAPSLSLKEQKFIGICLSSFMFNYVNNGVTNQAFVNQALNDQVILTYIAICFQHNISIAEHLIQFVINHSDINRAQNENKFVKKIEELFRHYTQPLDSFQETEVPLPLVITRTFQCVGALGYSIYSALKDNINCEVPQQLIDLLQSREPEFLLFLLSDADYCLFFLKLIDKGLNINQFNEHMYIQPSSSNISNFFENLEEAYKHFAKEVSNKMLYNTIKEKFKKTNPLYWMLQQTKEPNIQKLRFITIINHIINNKNLNFDLATIIPYENYEGNFLECLVETQQFSVLNLLVEIGVKVAIRYPNEDGRYPFEAFIDDDILSDEDYLNIVHKDAVVNNQHKDTNATLCLKIRKFILTSLKLCSVEQDGNVGRINSRVKEFIKSRTSASKMKKNILSEHLILINIIQNNFRKEGNVGKYNNFVNSMKFLESTIKEIMKNPHVVNAPEFSLGKKSNNNNNNDKNNDNNNDSNDSMDVSLPQSTVG